MRALVTVSSKHGGTEGIGRAIAEVLESAGIDVHLIPPAGVGSLDEYDVVVVGSALYMGRWMAPARDFVQGHADALRRRPVWLFASGPVTGKAEDPY
ncbi:MAG TPA: flavodoxin domain-containing protein, partial [Candidatus Limnocylindria bacterium]|nr:flavodoxin domain-containing protein [Candidatus Limnocylindria bacterium]